MATETPVVRYFVVCDEIVKEEDGRSLRNLRHDIVRLPGQPFPCSRERMALYALVTNGRGKHRLAVELAFLDQGIERSIKTSATFEVDFG